MSLSRSYDAIPPEQRLKPPAQHMSEQTTAEFYAHVLRLLGDNPPALADAPMVAKMASFGLVAAESPTASPLAWYHLPFLVAGRWCADQLVAWAAARPRTVYEGWALPPASLGSYGTDYVTRAVVATVALGANLPEDAVYPNARTDLMGDRLHGDKCYRLTFQRDNYPPVRAFWSMTAYGDNDYLIDNVLNRYAVGDRGGALHVDAEGTTDIWCVLSHTVLTTPFMFFFSTFFRFSFSAPHFCLSIVVFSLFLSSLFLPVTPVCRSYSLTQSHTLPLSHVCTHRHLTGSKLLNPLSRRVSAIGCLSKTMQFLAWSCACTGHGHKPSMAPGACPVWSSYPVSSRGWWHVGRIFRIYSLWFV
jgi:hypothetical protein